MRYYLSTWRRPRLSRQSEFIPMFLFALVGSVAAMLPLALMVVSR